MFSHNGKDRNMEACVVQGLLQTLSQSNHEHCSRSADAWWPSILLSIFCKNQNLSMKHKHGTAGRLINLQRMGGFYWYYYLLLEPQMTCFCSPLAYNNAAGIQHLAEAQMQQIRDRNWRQKWQIFSPTNTILNINDKAVWRPQSKCRFGGVVHSSF